MECSKLLPIIFFCFMILVSAGLLGVSCYERWQITQPGYVYGDSSLLTKYVYVQISAKLELTLLPGST